MHIVAIGHPLLTAVIGLFFDIYEEPVLGTSCYVGAVPKTCGDGPGKTGEKCYTIPVAVTFMALPAILVLCSLIINNLIISIFTFRMTSVYLQKNNQSDPENLTNDDGGTFGSSERISDDGSEVAIEVSSAIYRLRLVQTQAFLFVGSYFITIQWALIIASYEFCSSYEERLVLSNDKYWLSVLNAFFLPSLGLLSFLVYIRPKYMKTSRRYPKESRWSVIRRIFHGSASPPAPQTPADEVPPGSQNTSKIELQDQSLEFARSNGQRWAQQNIPNLAPSMTIRQVPRNEVEKSLAPVQMTEPKSSISSLSYSQLPPDGHDGDPGHFIAAISELTEPSNVEDRSGNGTELETPPHLPVCRETEVESVGGFRKQLESLNFSSRHPAPEMPPEFESIIEASWIEDILLEQWNWTAID